MGRAPCCDKANVKKGPWSPEEDGKLRAYIEQYGTGGNWIGLPNKIGLRRCGKSCRLRWLNYLRPNIKRGGFSEEEDSIICSLYVSIGSRWSVIAAQLPGRTDNDIKNYWNTRLKKRMLGNWKQSPNGHLSAVDHESKNEPHSPSLSTSAIERLKLHTKLQRCQNPFSFYNSPALQQDPNAQIGRFDGPFEVSVQPMQSNLLGSNQKPEQPENSLMSAITFEGGSSSVNQDTMPKSMDIDQMVAGLQSQHSNLPLGEMARYIGQDDRLYGSNGVKETISTEENVIWWASDVDTKSSSSISWDSASVLQSEGLFPEYVMGYDIR